MEKTKRLMKGELIGLKVRIINGKDPSLVGVEGKIVDETKQLLIIESKGKEKKLVKAICRFEFPSEKVRLDGKKIAYRPEDRIKRAR
jgi:ribonuclease P protein subunit POP4